MKSITGPSLGVFKVNNWAKSNSIIGPRSFSHYKNRGFRRFFFAQLSLCVCAFPQLSGNFCEIAWVILNFQSQDASDGGLSLLLSCHPGLHDDCRYLSLSLSLVDGYDDCH